MYPSLPVIILFCCVLYIDDSEANRGLHKSSRIISKEFLANCDADKNSLIDNREFSKDNCIKSLGAIFNEDLLQDHLMGSRNIYFSMLDIDKDTYITEEVFNIFLAIIPSIIHAFHFN